MDHLTAGELKMLRCTLGLHDTNRVYPSRNLLSPVYAERDSKAFASLMQRGYLVEKHRPDAPGNQPKRFYAATHAGRVAVEDMPWK